MKVIISGLVWLPRAHLLGSNLDNIRRDLTIFPQKTTDIQSKEEPEPIFLYREDDKRDLIGVPRQYYLEKKIHEHEEVLDISYGKPMQNLKTKYRSDGPYREQEVAIEALFEELTRNKWGGAMLRANPGFGKTMTAIELARRVGRRTLVLVHKDFLVQQWINSIHSVMPDANIGIIKQKKCEFDRMDSGEEPDFVVGLLQSLSRPDKYPDDLFGAFGTLVSDEAHRISAQSWASVVPMFNAAYRVGLSATLRRKDGAQDVFFKNISPITYNAKTQLMKPKLRRIFTASELRPISRGNYQVATSNLNSAQVLNQLCADSIRTKDIVDDLVRGVMAGRKILVVSERLGHLKDMAEQLGAILFDREMPFVPIIDFHTGQWFTGEVWEEWKRGKNGKVLHRKGDPKFKTRTKEENKKAEVANVIFCTKQQLEEGFNLPPVDVLVMATPMSDIEQIVGRVQRWCTPSDKCERWCSWRADKCEGKSDPIVVDIIDENIPRLRNKYRKRLQFYKKMGVVE